MAPVTANRRARIVSHLRASASSRHSAGIAGKSSRWTERLSGSREAQASSAVKTSTGASHTVAARKMCSIASSALEAPRARGRVAIERVLADVEVKGGQVRVHERRKERGHPGVIEVGVGVAHLRVEFRQSVQHQPVEFGHAGDPDRGAPLVMGERAQHPADRVAQLAVVVGDGLEDLRSDALVVGIVDARHPKTKDVGAGNADDVLRERLIAERLRLLAAFLVEREAMRQHDVERRAAARAAALEQRRLEPAAMLVRTLEIHHLVRTPVDSSPDSGQPGKWRGSSRTKACVDPESNQTSTRLSILS